MYKFANEYLKSDSFDQNTGKLTVYIVGAILYKSDSVWTGLEVLGGKGQVHKVNPSLLN